MPKFGEPGRWKNVLCVYPYRYRNPFHVFPPLALEYLAGGIGDLAEKITIVDMRFEPDIRPYLEGVDIVCTFGHFEDCSIFGKMKEHSLKEVAKLLPDDVPLVTGGTVSMDVEKVFRECEKLDVVIRGNPEFPIRALFQKGSPEGIPNLVYRADHDDRDDCGDGLVRNEVSPHPLSNDILPARELRRYSYRAGGIEADIVRASVGCNYRCTFCYQFGKGPENTFMRWQGRTAESIFEELKASPGEIVAFIDDDLLVDMDNIERLCDLIIASRMKKTFIGNARITHILGRKKTLKKMERAGFLSVSYGVESLYDRTLKLYRKGTTVKKIEEGLRLAAKTNMILTCSFILGSPGETEQEILNYLKFARRFDIDTVVTNRLRIPEKAELRRILYDPVTGKLKDRKHRMIAGEELAKIKYAIKYGQRTPLRLLIILLKLGRHRGLSLDPFFIITSFIYAGLTGRAEGQAHSEARPALMGVGAKPSFLVRWPIRVLLFVFRARLWRLLNRIMSTFLYRPVKLLNRVVEFADDRLKVSVTLLPRLFGWLRRRVYEKQKMKYGWKPK